jgi:hypothetical protein
MQPFIQNDLSIWQWAACGIWVVYMTFIEGYKSFQLKFSPMVVRRAYSLHERPGVFNYLLAGPYSMGLFDANKKRMIVSWSITVGVFGLVSIVKKLPYPYRSIIDAGVVAGLSYGAISMCVIFIQALCGRLPETDPAFPEVKNESKTD